MAVSGGNLLAVQKFLHAVSPGGPGAPGEEVCLTPCRKVTNILLPSLNHDGR